MWVLKTWLLTAIRPLGFPIPESSVTRFDLSEVPDDIYGWLVEAKRPHRPASRSGQRERAGAPADGNPRYRIPLPTITADGRTVRFQEFTSRLDLLDAGVLDVELVYHPGWEIDHPLEREGRGARLWPRDGRRALDIGALPLLESRELSWFRGPRLVFAPSTYRRQTTRAAVARDVVLVLPAVSPGRHRGLCARRVTVRRHGPRV